MGWSEIGSIILEYLKELLSFIGICICFFINKKLKKIVPAKTSSTESNKIDSDENIEIAEETAEESAMKVETIETPVTTVKRELSVVMSEEEAMALRNVLESSGRVSDVKPLYQAVQNFFTTEK